MGWFSTNFVHPPHAHSFVSAKIEGCVLGKNTKIGLKAELIRCVTQAGYEISAGGLLYFNLTVLLIKLSAFCFLPFSKTRSKTKSSKLRIGRRLWM